MFSSKTTKTVFWRQITLIEFLMLFLHRFLWVSWKFCRFFRTWDHAQPCAHLAQSAPTLSWGTPSIQTLRFVDEYMTLQCYSGFTSVSLRAFWQMSGYYSIALRWVDFDPRNIGRSLFFLASVIAKELHYVCIELNGDAFYITVYRAGSINLCSLLLLLKKVLKRKGFQLHRCKHNSHSIAALAKLKKQKSTTQCNLVTHGKKEDDPSLSPDG